MLEKIIKLLQDLTSSGFYGSVTLKFMNGRFVHWQVLKDGKPEDL
jgi:hypothetical protein